jgi:hypothetical protein
MPIIDLSGAQVEAQPAHSNCGVIIYRMDPVSGDVEGLFALALYGGQLARETGRKIEGTPGDFAGAYEVTTYAPDSSTFATGTMTAAPLGGEGVYEVTWNLLPVEGALKSMGYAPGTRLVYTALGMRLPGGAEVSVAWDNNLYVRRWPEDDGTGQWTYTVSGNVGPRPYIIRAG